MELRYYQKEALERAEHAIQSGAKKLRIAMAAGTGRTPVIAALAAARVKAGSRVLILSPKRDLCEQLHSMLDRIGVFVTVCTRSREYSGQDILLSTYMDVQRNGLTAVAGFPTIICDGIYFENAFLEEICLANHQAVYVGFTSSMSDKADGWFSNFKLIYRYTFPDAVKDGYSYQNKEFERIEAFCLHFLQKNGFDPLPEPPSQSSYGDLLVQKDGAEYLIEIKTYKRPRIPYETAYKALQQAVDCRLRSGCARDRYRLCLFLFSETDEALRRTAYEDHQILIADISNFIYLCRNDEALYNELLEAVPFSISSIPQRRLLAGAPFPDFPVLPPAAGTKGKISSDYAERLENCSPGRDHGADRQYEAICSAILRELFAADFDIMKEQLETTEGLFRMDMVCSIKLTNRDSFWGFLKHFYRTNYVVFEFKNYSDEVSQNPVCITEKYLSSMALRNVAFIISRRGFDKSAQKVALKSLKEHGNLIISLTDDDLLKMLTIKEDNREPSGYLMDKLNELLMYAD